MKIDEIISTDVRELFGEDDEVGVRSHHGVKSSIKSRVPALPTRYYEQMIGLKELENNNPYNRLITAIEMVECVREE